MVTRPEREELATTRTKSSALTPVGKQPYVCDLTETLSVAVANIATQNTKKPLELPNTSDLLISTV
ncbi:MAG: hypothetical protein ABL999_13760 [Pyrinomonadaceae bacterium]